jgi:hypothetical protein
MSRSQRRTVPLVVLAAVAVGAIVFAQTGRKPVVASSVQVNNDRKAAPLVVVSADGATRKPLEYYTSGVRSDLFVTPEAPKPEVKKEAPKKVVALPAAAPVIVDPFADYAYSGTVGMNDQLVALVENIKTREGQYLKVGDDFLGGKVSQVTDRMVSVTTPTGPKMMAKSDDYKMASLDKSAGFLQPNTQQGVPGAPGQTGAMPAGPGGAPGMPGQFTGGGRPNWQNMTDEQRQQMRERFMNRQFNGGGGGRRGGFGGFGGGGRRGGISGGADFSFGGM